MKHCSSCGMPLEKKEDFARGDESSDFCLYCVREDGSAKPCQEVFEGGVGFFMETTGCDRALAEKVTRKNMLRLPYWQGKDEPVLSGPVATDEEFQEALNRLE